MPLTAGTRIGAYEILRMVGAGGMGEVYLAREPSIMAVALTLSPELKAGRPRELFKADIFDGLHTKDVMPDGSKFLVVQKSRETPPPARLTVVTDWSGRK